MSRVQVNRPNFSGAGSHNNGTAPAGCSGLVFGTLWNMEFALATGNRITKREAARKLRKLNRK